MAVDILEKFNLGVDRSGTVEPIKGTPYETGAIYPILSVVIKNVFVIAGLILFIFILIGGLGMIINAGNAEKQKQSSNTLGSAVTGFIIIMVSYWIIRIIEILTGVTIFA